MASKLYVGNLPFDATEEQVSEFFSQVGEVNSVKIITNRETGKSRGFCFVEMENDDEADQAIEKLNDTELEGRKIVVNVARPREERPRFDNRNRGFRRDDRGSRRGDNR